MLKTLGLTATLLAGLALPALAQAPSTAPATGTSRPTPPASATTGPTGSTGTGTTSGTGSGSTGTNRSGAASSATTSPTTGHSAATSTPSATATTPPSTSSATTARPTAGTPSTTTSTPSGSGSSSARTATGAAAGTAAGAATATASSNKIDINGANEQQLASLPGIGPATAKNIVQGRPWDDLNDLVKKKAVSQSVFDRNKDRFALANINTSSVADLAKTLPGIGDVRARNIVNNRPYATPQDLVTKKVVSEREFEKIKDLIAY